MVSLPSSIIPRGKVCGIANYFDAPKADHMHDNPRQQIAALQAELAQAKASIALLNAEAEELTEQLHTQRVNAKEVHTEFRSLMSLISEHCKCGVMSYPVFDQAPD